MSNPDKVAVIDGASPGTGAAGEDSLDILERPRSAMTPLDEVAKNLTALGSRPSAVSSTTPIVFVVDDDPSVRESIEALISTEDWRAESFASARDFLARPRVEAPSCLILDVNLPDLNGLDLQQQISGERLDMPIIFITGFVDVSMTVRAMKAGAVEFLIKPFAEDALLGAIRHAIERSRAKRRHEAELQSLRDCYTSLSRREREVMALVVAGRLNKQVGGELGISEITVKAHRGRVMEKMKARSLADLVTLNVKLHPGLAT
jgi:FixJ family two-component response regulator